MMVLLAVGPLAAAESLPPPTLATHVRSVTLAEAIALSAETAGVRASRLQEDAERQRLYAERMALVPRISADASTSRQVAVPEAYGSRPTRTLVYNSFEARVRVGQTIIDRAAWNRVRAAAWQRDVATANVQLAVEQGAEEAANGWLSLMRAQAQAAERQSELELARRVYELSRAQVTAGVADTLAIGRAASRVAASRTDLARTQQQREQAALELARILNVEPEVPLRSGGTLSEATVTTAVPSSTTAALVLAQQARPEWTAAQATIARLGAVTAVEASGRYPVLEAFGDVGAGGPDVHDTRSRWQVGLRVSVSLLDGTDFRAAAADFERQREQTRAEDLHRRILVDVRSAATALDSGVIVVAAARDEQRVSREQLERATSRFADGASSNIDVIDAQLALARADDELVDAYAKLATARIRLARAVGVASSIR